VEGAQGNSGGRLCLQSCLKSSDLASWGGAGNSAGKTWGGERDEEHGIPSLRGAVPTGVRSSV
jgi:hypothetical protein